MDVARRIRATNTPLYVVLAAVVVAVALRVTPGLLVLMSYAGGGLLGLGAARCIPAMRVLGVPLDRLLFGVVLTVLIAAPVFRAPPRVRCGMVLAPGALTAAVARGAGEVATGSCERPPE